MILVDVAEEDQVDLPQAPGTRTYPQRSLDQSGPIATTNQHGVGVGVASLTVSQKDRRRRTEDYILELG